MAGSINLKVDSSALINQSKEIENKINQLEGKWRNIQVSVNRSKSYWEGDAGNAHQRYYNDIKDDIETIFKRLREHPTELLQMAGFYEQTEKNISMAVNTLPDDIIS